MSRSTGHGGHGQQEGSEDTILSQGYKSDALASLDLAARLNITENQDEHQGNTQTYQTDDNFDLQGSTNDRLEKFMSCRSVISTSSSLARRNTEASMGDTYREIGTGGQGVVFEQPGSIDCYKLKLMPESSALWNNYTMQKRIKEAFDAAVKAGLSVDVQCPEAKAWVNPQTSLFWDEAVDKFQWPENMSKMKRQRHYGFSMERIFPVPAPFRHVLIDKYCEEKYKEQAKADPENRDCLIRIYLGREEPLRTNRRFKLRNFPMDIARFEAGRLPGAQYAHAIAGAMAILHWQAKVDADHVEFVLGSSPLVTTRVQLSADEVSKLNEWTDETYSVVHSYQKLDFKHRTMVLWVMDFDRCKDITMDQEGVSKAVESMKRNNYCPKTGGGNEYQEGLWKVFRERYLEVSQKLLPDGSGHLADSFIEGFAIMCADHFKRQAADADDGTSSAAANPSTPWSPASQFGGTGPISTTRADRTSASWEGGDDAGFQVGSFSRRGRGGSRDRGTGGGSWRAGRGGSVDPGRGRGVGLAGTSWRDNSRGGSAPPPSFGRASGGSIRGSPRDRSKVAPGIGMDAWDRFGRGGGKAGGRGGPGS